MRPEDFATPTEATPLPRRCEGLSHEQLQAANESNYRHKYLREKAAHRFRAMQASRPDLRFAKDAEERIYRELLAEREEQLRRDAEAREASARNSEELVQRMQSERDRLKRQMVQVLVKRLSEADLEPEDFASAVVDLLALAKRERIDDRLIPELFRGIV